MLGQRRRRWPNVYRQVFYNSGSAAFTMGMPGVQIPPAFLSFLSAGITELSEWRMMMSGLSRHQMYH